jgi:hypothetical protein
MRIVAVAFISFCALASCGPSLQQTCQDYATAWCNQHYNCTSGTTLQNLQAQYGETAADCAQAFSNEARCTSNAEITPCGVGTSYDSSEAETCVTQYSQLQCSDIAANVTPPACETSAICH